MPGKLLRAFNDLTKAQISIKGKDSSKEGGLVDHILALEKDE